MKRKNITAWLLVVAFLSAIFFVAPQEAEAISRTPNWVTRTIQGNEPAVGEVKTYDAIIEADDTYANKWTVKMLVAARNKVTTADVVLVIDTSGSMDNASRLRNAKKAAKNFVETMFESDGASGMRIGLVSFDADATVKTRLSNDKRALTNAINGLSADGGTNTQAGMHAARKMLENSTANQKFIVLLSDGKPTYSYKINFSKPYNDYFSLEHWDEYGNIYVLKDNVPEKKYKYSGHNSSHIVGDGRILLQEIWEDEDYYYHHGNSAIAEAGFAKNSNGIEIFSIALSADDTGTGILKKIASDDAHFTSTTDSSALQDIYERIATKIITAATAPTVDFDYKCGESYTMPGFEATAVKHSNGTAYNPIDNKWVLTEGIDEAYGNNIYYEWVEFTMDVTDGALTIPGVQEKEAVKPFAAQLKYKNSAGQDDSKAFNIGNVKVKLYSIKKELDVVTASLKADKFNFTIEEKGRYSSWRSVGTVQLSDNDKTTILKNIKLGKTYRVYETTTGTRGIQSFNIADVYKPSAEKETEGVTIGNAAVNGGFIPASITVPRNKNIADYQAVKFINQEKGTLTVKKAFATGDQAPSASYNKTKFTVEVKDANGTVVKTLTLKKGDEQPLTLPFGDYTVEETETFGCVPSYEGFDNNGKVTINKNNVNRTVTVTNAKGSGKTVVAKKNWVNRPAGETANAEFILMQKVGNNEPTVVTGKQPDLTTSENGEQIYTWSCLDEYVGNQRCTYDVKEKGETAGKVTIGDCNYSVNKTVDPKNEKFEFTNTYIDEGNGSITLKKEFAKDVQTDFNKETEFEITVTGGPDNNYFNVITLKAGDSVPVSSLKEGIYTVKETKNKGYTPSYTVNGESVVSGDNGISVKINNKAKKATVTVTNGTDKNMFKNVTATKTWINPPVKDPETKLILKRNGNKVNKDPNITPTIDGDGNIVQTYTWENVEVYDANWEEFTYTVEEDNVVDGKVIIGENTYEVSQDGTNITNTYVEPTDGTLTIEKKFAEGNPSDANATFTFTITGTATDYTNDITLSVNDKGKYIGTLTGLPYDIYTIKEQQVVGYSPMYDPTNGQVVIDKDSKNATVIVTNYRTETDDLIAQKEWSGTNSNTDLPTVVIKLMKQVGNSEPEFVSQKKATAESNWQVNFGKLPKKDANTNKDIKYTFEEELYVDAFDSKENWKKDITGSTITNTLKDPSETNATLTIKKVVKSKDGSELHQEDTVNDDVSQTVNSQLDDPVSNDSVEDVNALDSSSSSVSAALGNDRIESGANNLADESVVVDGDSIVRSGDDVIDGEEDEKDAEGDDNTTPINPMEQDFKIIIAGPHGYYKEEIVSVSNPEVSLNGLHYGTYTITEDPESSKGYEVTYNDQSATSYTVRLEPDAADQTVTITNTATFEVKEIDVNEKVFRYAHKIWNGGDVNDYANAPLTLTRLSFDQQKVVAEGIKPDDEVSQNDDGSYLYTWSNQPKYDDNEKEYVYKVVEETNEDGFAVINGRTYRPDKTEVLLPTSAEEVANGINFVTFTNTFVEKEPENPPKPNDGNSSDGDYSDKVKPKEKPVVKEEVKEPPKLNKQDHFAYMFGYPDNGFRPNGYITRAEVTSMFARLLVDPMDENKTFTNNFSDVPEGQWYTNTVGYMSQEGIIKGYEDGTFRPNAPVTRAEFAAIASRFDKLTAGESNFPDVPANHWAKTAIDFAFTKGWVNGYEDGTFRPENNQTRAETVSIVNKMLERKADQDFIKKHDAEIIYFNDLVEGHWAYWEIMEATNGHDYERTGNNIDELWLCLKDYKKNF